LRFWESDRGRSLLNAAMLLGGGLAGAALLTALHVPAGALMGSVAGSMAVNGLVDGMARRRAVDDGGQPQRVRLPRAVRVVGQVLLGVLAGARLTPETLQILLVSAVPVVVSVAMLLALSFLLARYLFSQHGVDRLTAIMATAPGGISELASVAEQRGAAMHIVLAIHLFRVLLVVLVVLPIVLVVLRGL
jgi:uncharacterized protein